MIAPKGNTWYNLDETNNDSEEIKMNYMITPPPPIPPDAGIKPQYIVLFKGDDSDFVGNQSIDIVIDTELDLTGCKAHFRFMDFVQDFDEIPADKTLHLVFPHEKTNMFPLGAADASLVLEDASHRLRTIGNRIHIVVTKSVPEAYANEDTQAITVTVTGTVTWDMIQDKPDIPTPQDIPQPSDSEPLMDGEASAGISDEYARGDHRHPSDDSKRGVNDLGVRGAPHGEGSWFTLNGDRLDFNDGVWGDRSLYRYIDSDGMGGYLFYDGLETPVSFYLDQNYTSTIEEYTVIGYVDILASEGYVNSAVVTNTANFLGTFDYVNDLHFSPPASSSDVSNSDIATALLSAVSSPSNNDYVFVKIDYTATTPEDEFRRFKFDGASSVWRYEYTLNSASFTPSQWAAINSGITANKVAQIDDKLDGAAAYPAWDPTRAYHEQIVSYGGRLWYAFGTAAIGVAPPEEPWVEKTVSELLAGKQDALSSAQLAAANSGATAAKVATWDGYAATIAAKASFADLPYAMVTPGEWEFSGSGVESGVVYTCIWSDSGGAYNLYADGVYLADYESAYDNLTEITFQSVGITATRASLPGHLLARANNLIDATTGNVTLTLPPFVAGKVRDLLVACTIGLDGNDEPWSVIFQGQGSEAPSGADEISFKAEGDDASSATFPVPDAAGDWWYSLTERAPHVFAVSLKQLQSVSQPTHGGA